MHHDLKLSISTVLSSILICKAFKGYVPSLLQPCVLLSSRYNGGHWFCSQLSGIKKQLY